MTISNEIIKVLDYLGQKFGIAIDWTNTNVIPYIQELIGKYISWEIATSITWGVIGLVVVVICVILATIEAKTYCSDGFLYIITGFFGILGLIIIGTQVFDIMRCIYFPELQVVEYVKLLMSQNN